MHAVVVEASEAVLDACAFQQPLLVEPLGRLRFAQRLGGPGNDHEMGEADFAGNHRVDALANGCRLPAHAHTVGDLARRHLAIPADPLDGACVSLPDPLLGGGHESRLH